MSCDCDDPYAVAACCDECCDGTNCMVPDYRHRDGKPDE